MFPPLKWEIHRQQQETQDKHLVSEINQILQDNCMFIYIHLTQEEDWCLVRAVITTHTNSFLKQWEHKGMILLNNKMIVTSLLHWLNIKDLTGDIIREKDQIKTNSSIPLIKDLEMSDIFKNENNKKGNSVIDELITEVL